MAMEIDEILKIVKEKLVEQKKKIQLEPTPDMYEIGTFKGMREIYRIIKDLKEI